MPKKLSKPESVFKNCGICGTKGEIGTCFSASIFVIEIRKIWKKVRSYYKVPEKYSHWFYGGYGSIGFDGSSRRFFSHKVCACLSFPSRW